MYCMHFIVIVWKILDCFYLLLPHSRWVSVTSVLLAFLVVIGMAFYDAASCRSYNYHWSRGFVSVKGF